MASKGFGDSDACCQASVCSFDKVMKCVPLSHEHHELHELHEPDACCYPKQQK